MLQQDLLLPWRTVLGNVLLAPRLHRKTGAHRSAALALLRRHGLDGFADHYPHALSGGMRQRVALVRTLLVARGLLLLDEPFGALDAHARMAAQAWLLDVWGEIGAAVLLVTHDLDEALFLADRVVVLGPRPGRIVGELDVPLGRPRARELVVDERFAALRRELFHALFPAEERAAPHGVPLPLDERAGGAR
jgi:ABC-type nitrate/sulfonate/bicarbonate transport system ATPase subunit